MTTSTTPDADYAFWAIPGTSSKVTYSLGTFHEIDFVVNEGYRRIPHGGIEMAGLLFGRANEEGVRIESFRPIECEHASGPSFNLSEKDIAALEKQISSAASDPELNGLEVMGWFIAHTRGPLKLTEKEKLLFDRFFPAPKKLTVLIKPERFHPTRFGFLIRESQEQMNTDATASAIILPGRGTQGREGPVPSIAAPPETSDGRPSERIATETTSKRAIPLREPPPELHLPLRAPQAVDQSVDRPIDQRIGQPTTPAATPDILVPEIENAPVSPVVQSPAAIVRSLPVERVSPPPVAAPRSLPEIELPRARRRATALADDRKAYGFQFALVLLIAAFLGCCVGYWAYLQLPSAIIPLAIQKQQNTFIVSWSPSQTRTSAYAAVRVDDGEPVMLSSAEKIAGRTTVVNSANDVKVELIAQHWLRDSRGIVRFVSGAQSIPSAAPAAPNLKPGLSGSVGGSQLP